jgi:hypothetical protein
VEYWLFALIQPPILVGAYEVGYRLGRRWADTERGKSESVVWQAQVLALLGLLIAFSFGMAETRFETRRQIIVDEANAIGTTYLRAGFLGDPGGGELHRLLRSYVDARIEFYEAGTDRPRVLESLRTASRLQEQIWSRVEAAVRADPHAMAPSLLAQATNEMIDMEGSRRASVQQHVPWPVFAMLLVVAATGVALIGHSAGLDGARFWFGMIAMPLLIAAVITLIYDLDHPRLGLVRLGQESMLALRAGL